MLPIQQQKNGIFACTCAGCSPSLLLPTDIKVDNSVRVCPLKMIHPWSFLCIKRNYMGRKGWYTSNKTKNQEWRKDFLGRWRNRFLHSVCMLMVVVVVVVIVIVAAVFGKHVCYLWDVIVATLLVHYAMRIDWMIWKIADPHTTKMNSANSQGPTGYFSSAVLFDLGTLPRWVMFRLAFSLAMRILCCGAIFAVFGCGGGASSVV